MAAGKQNMIKTNEREGDKVRKMRKKCLSAILIWCVLAMLLCGCGKDEKSRELSGTNRESIVVEQIRAKLQAEDEKLHGYADPQKLSFTIEKAVPGSFTKPDAKEVLLQVDAEQEVQIDTQTQQRHAFYIAAVFDRETLEWRAQKNLFAGNTGLYALPVTGETDRILYLGETVNMGLSGMENGFWKLEGGQWNAMPLPEIPEADGQTNLSAEFNKKNQLILLYEKIHGTSTLTGDVKMITYFWEPAIGEFRKY